MVKNTLTVGRIEEGFVLDHIQAGRSMDIYKYLHLDKLDCCVAIIKNAKSNKMGKKDIMKIECPIDFMDLDILGFIDHNITVNIIKNSAIVDKKALHLPHEIRNVIHCKNPRCITSIEQGLDHIFVLTDPENVLESGIEIRVAPPGKVIKNLISLSGGEQSFVAICIYFAILKLKPAPFCILDEIDAALDEVNVKKYAQYLKKFTDKTQFVLVTHRRSAMEEANVLYGVTMQEDGISKLLKMEQVDIENTAQ